ncbi:MAG: flagellar assembly protein FliH [Methylomonas sp.]|nr:flagellar assembly protein FliH [Methylomonas sp.]PPD22430.1 MAG: flagellar assembly protein FliH [Methylomonas sp.]PPD24864.1 MAG: flagellar assembly protein FliH [Methylomonas sp.]PPD33730.1 MAG: flagellar assembly protein FliH [Methylomonas sp.]PPD42076.1 MAG: flagellar assembly protein FliH [Methylomonas sp.]
MSSAKAKFTADELQAVSPWTGLPEFGAPRSENVDVHQATQVLTVEDIEATQRQAYDEAFEQGRQQGYEQGRQQGYDEGHQQGYTDGQRQGQDQARHLLQTQAEQLASVLTTLNQPLQLIDAELENELLALVIAIAKQIIRREIKTDPGQIVAVIREAVQALPLGSQTISLKLHPDDAELVRHALDLDDNAPNWHLIENPLIARGGCVVESDMSSIDATLEKRIAAVIASVMGGDRQQDASA